MGRTKPGNMALILLLGTALAGCAATGGIKGNGEPHVAVASQGAAEPEQVVTPPAATHDATPVIHFVGTDSNLVVGYGTDGKPIPLQILVKGRNLDPGSVNIAAHVQGTVPAQAGSDYKIIPSTSGSGNTMNWDGSGFVVELASAYLERVSNHLQAGGQSMPLRVVVGVSAKTASGAGKPQAIGMGRFQLYRSADYQARVLAKRVPLNEITAYPLSSKEARYLFGPLVADNFFVVGLSVRNTSDKPRIFTTGMIRAAGVALVQPNGQSEQGRGAGGNGDRNYTLPVTTTPLSMEEVYKSLDDLHPWTGRSILFRGLELVGALASAASAPFVTSGDLVRGITLYSGVGIPGLKKFYPDPWPTYRSNVVAFAMPDLVKVGPRSELNQKFIFFSKNRVQANVQDPALFGPFEVPQGNGFLVTPDLNWYESFFPGDEQQQPGLPKMSVVSLFFNDLDIPYEEVLTVAEKTIQNRTTTLRLQAEQLHDTLVALQNGWHNPPAPAAASTTTLLGLLRHDQWRAVDTGLSQGATGNNWKRPASPASAFSPPGTPPNFTLTGFTSPLTNKQANDFATLQGNAKTVLDALAPAALAGQLGGDKALGVTTVRGIIRRLGEIEQLLAADVPDPAVVQKGLDALEQQLNDSRAALWTVQTQAGMVAALHGLVNTLNPPRGGAVDKADFDQAVAALTALIATTQ